MTGDVMGSVVPVITGAVIGISVLPRLLPPIYRNRAMNIPSSDVPATVARSWTGYARSSTSSIRPVTSYGAVSVIYPYSHARNSSS